MKKMNKIAVIVLAGILTITVLSGCQSNKTESAANGGTTQPAAATPDKPKEAKQMITAEQFPQEWLKGNYEAIYNQLSADFRKQVTLADIISLSKDFSKGITSLTELTKMELHGNTRYAWVDQTGQKGVEASFDKDNKIVGMMLHPLKSYPATDNAFTKIEYALPFQGEWYTFWGGTNVIENYHYEGPGERYAFDFVQMKDGSSYKGDPAKNESYYAFGSQAVAPADGKVVVVVNDIPDNDPVGTFNETQPAGNNVVIDHGNGEYSLVAHLKMGSVSVKVGDIVKTGDPIGLCGNSGNSSEAHIHFQVADDPDIFKGNSIRVKFKGGADYVQGDTAKAP